LMRPDRWAVVMFIALAVLLIVETVAIKSCGFS
jgi:hypothetical protein